MSERTCENCTGYGHCGERQDDGTCIIPDRGTTHHGVDRWSPSIEAFEAAEKEIEDQKHRERVLYERCGHLQDGRDIALARVAVIKEDVRVRVDIAGDDKRYAHIKLSMSQILDIIGADLKVERIDAKHARVAVNKEAKRMGVEKDGYLLLVKVTP